MKLFLILIALLSVSAQVMGSEPVAVSEVLRSCRQYDGRTLTIKGRYFANRHGSSFVGDRVFATADWTRYKGEPVNLDSIILYRDPRGRPAGINGMVTAVVKVKCIRNFQLHKDPSSDEDFGNGEGYNGLGAARFYVIHVEAVQPLPRDNNSK
jgi:hypothetical protein